MMSPIAIQSAKEAAERAAAGEGIKGSGRRRTEYTRPSIKDSILAAVSIDALADLRRNLVIAIAAGGMRKADDKTRSAWEEALWQRVVALILGAETAEEASYIYNVILRWPKLPHVAFAIEAALEVVGKILPSPAERLAREGITIEGVTS